MQTSFDIIKYLKTCQNKTKNYLATRYPNIANVFVIIKFDNTVRVYVISKRIFGDSIMSNVIAKTWTIAEIIRYRVQTHLIFVLIRKQIGIQNTVIQKSHITVSLMFL